MERTRETEEQGLPKFRFVDLAGGREAVCNFIRASGGKLFPLWSGQPDFKEEMRKKFGENCETFDDPSLA